MDIENKYLEEYFSPLMYGFTLLQKYFDVQDRVLKNILNKPESLEQFKHSMLFNNFPRLKNIVENGKLLKLIEKSIEYRKVFSHYYHEENHLTLGKSEKEVIETIYKYTYEYINTFKDRSIIKDNTDNFLFYKIKNTENTYLTLKGIIFFISLFVSKSNIYLIINEVNKINKNKINKEDQELLMFHSEKNKDSIIPSLENDNIIDNISMLHQFIFYNNNIKNSDKDFINTVAYNILYPRFKKKDLIILKFNEINNELNKGIVDDTEKKSKLPMNNLYIKTKGALVISLNEKFLKYLLSHLSIKKEINKEITDIYEYIDYINKQLEKKEILSIPIKKKELSDKEIKVNYYSEKAKYYEYIKSFYIPVINQEIYLNNNLSTEKNYNICFKTEYKKFDNLSYYNKIISFSRIVNKYFCTTNVPSKNGKEKYIKKGFPKGIFKNFQEDLFKIFEDFSNRKDNINSFIDNINKQDDRKTGDKKYIIAEEILNCFKDTENAEKFFGKYKKLIVHCNNIMFNKKIDNENIDNENIDNEKKYYPIKIIYISITPKNKSNKYYTGYFEFLSNELKHNQDRIEHYTKTFETQDITILYNVCKNIFYTKFSNIKINEKNKFVYNNNEKNISSKDRKELYRIFIYVNLYFMFTNQILKLSIDNIKKIENKQEIDRTICKKFKDKSIELHNYENININLKQRTSKNFLYIIKNHMFNEYYNYILNKKDNNKIEFEDLNSNLKSLEDYKYKLISFLAKKEKDFFAKNHNKDNFIKSFDKSSYIDFILLLGDDNFIKILDIKNTDETKNILKSLRNYFIHEKDKIKDIGSIALQTFFDISINDKSFKNNLNPIKYLIDKLNK